jgi:glyoxylase-like metal-dependent hydrolase (beta-lactamase superfamily II)
MPAYICKTCGVQYAPTPAPPSRCLICEDERQYVGWQGQEWTTLDQMRANGFTNEVRLQEPGLHGIGTRPAFAIGQRALLVQTPQGNLLWDCISLLDEQTIAAVRALGGVHAISASHPHFYGVMQEWSWAFGDAPIYIPEDDKEWVTYPGPSVRLWRATREVLPGVTLVQCGGHFEGSAVVHWSAGAGGEGALLVGDTFQVVQDRRWVSFMRSYPNIIPLPEHVVRRMVDTIRPYAFDKVYGGWWGRDVERNGKAAIERSAERYAKWVRA